MWKKGSGMNGLGHACWPLGWDSNEEQANEDPRRIFVEYRKYMKLSVRSGIGAI